jgi:hypothetical protein
MRNSRAAVSPHSRRGDMLACATRSHAFYKANGFREIPQAEVPVKYDYPDRNSLFFRLDLN